MVKKTIGIILIIVGVIIMIVLLSQGMVFPHILGPLTLAVIGIILLTLKQKKVTMDPMNKKRILLIVTVLAIIILIGILIGMFGPDLMKRIMDMHRGG